LEDKAGLARQNCLEPACGAGHMARPLKEYFGEVRAADAYEYGYGDVRDFLTYPYETNAVDWVITNPPFRLGEQFVLRALSVAKVGVAILARTVFLEGAGRFERIFRDAPPTKFAQFTERVPMLRGRLDRKASTATGYAWLIWEKHSQATPRLMWVPPCRKALERDSDYQDSFLSNIASASVRGLHRAPHPARLPSKPSKRPQYRAASVAPLDQ
jgi:hypothetical protein